VTVIRGASQLIAGQPEASLAAIRRPLERIARAVTAMEEAIDVFLLLAREQANGIPSTPCHLRTVVEQVVEQHRHMLDNDRVELTIDIDPHLTVDAPTPVLDVVLGNLVRNAFARTASGTIRITCQDGALTVADTGPGIPPAIVDRATEAHVKGPDSSGHGLGLSIVRTVCERFGWHLQLTSEEGRGTNAVVAFGE
jgi:signal transduction histidine kinase